MKAHEMKVPEPYQSCIIYNDMRSAPDQGEDELGYRAGMQRVAAYAHWYFYDRTSDNKPDYAKGISPRRMREKMPGGYQHREAMGSLDIEPGIWNYWAHSQPIGSYKYRWAIDQLILAAETYREIFPYRRFGIYWHIPSTAVKYWLYRYFWDPTPPDRAVEVYKDWVRRIEDHERLGLVDAVDVLQPSFYLGDFRWIDNGRLQAVVSNMARVAKDMNKKCYGYVMPQGHPWHGNPNAWDVMTGDQFTKVLDIIYNYCDGVMMYCMRVGAFPEGLNTEWFQHTLRWVYEHSTADLVPGFDPWIPDDERSEAIVISGGEEKESDLENE